MKEEEFGPIEQEITKEEIPQKTAGAGPKSPPKINFAKILQVALNILKGFKRPKIVTLIILVGIGVLVFLVLSLLTVKEEREVTKPQFQETKTPPSPTSDASVANIAQRVETYGKKVAALDNFKKKLTKPIVDLEIDFEEE